jgi:hypothetical protein
LQTSETFETTEVDFENRLVMSADKKFSKCQKIFCKICKNAALSSFKMSAMHIGKSSLKGIEIKIIFGGSLKIDQLKTQNFEQKS